MALRESLFIGYTENQPYTLLPYSNRLLYSLRVRTNISNEYVEEVYSEPATRHYIIICFKRPAKGWKHPPPFLYPSWPQTAKEGGDRISKLFLSNTWGKSVMRAHMLVGCLLGVGMALHLERDMRVANGQTNDEGRQNK